MSKKAHASYTLGNRDLKKPATFESKTGSALCSRGTDLSSDQTYLSNCVFNIVFQKSTPPQIQNLSFCITSMKNGLADLLRNWFLLNHVTKTLCEMKTPSIRTFYASAPTVPQGTGVWTWEQSFIERWGTPGLSDTNSLLVFPRKSTPPHTRQLNILRSSSEQSVDHCVGELTF